MALVTTCLLAASPAAATDLPSKEVRSLAARAPNDGDALRRLRSVDEVDGVPVDLPAALDARGDRLEARLRALAAGPAPGSTDLDAAAARARAGTILADRRFHPAPAPRPFRGIIEVVSRRLQPLQEALGRAWRWLAARLPGGERLRWGILGLAAVLTAAVVTLRIARRRARALASPAGTTPGTSKRDPRALERAAEEAERRGDLRAAIRLRFQAGLLRLDHARMIEWRPSLTSGEVRRRLRSPAFARLARSFDEIVYGGRDPLPDDVTAARRGWAELIEASAPARGARPA